MLERAGLNLRNTNPDVLTCIANLSNDEIFTPPELANRMLDRVAEAWSADNSGASIWADPSVKFLDPFTKSGVFLREITSRLTAGLSAEIPELETRVEHILTQQVYGIAITRLTGLIARRSVYCSKSADSGHSIARSFSDSSGNIWFEPTEHSWVNSACAHCGSGRKSLDRDASFESHAYAFIHTYDINARMRELFGENMQFDVIIGNPPYQLNDGGGSGTSAQPIYNKFVDQAKALEPRLLSMVIPARWFSGGKGLDDFRESMLTDDRIRTLVDYPDSNDVFHGTQIKGGICYFLWNRDERGEVTVTTMDKGVEISTATRPLLELGTDIFIRYNEALPILEKVMAVESGNKSGSLALPEGKRFESLVSTRRPFGDIESALHSGGEGDVLVYRVGGTSTANSESITVGLEYLNEYKVIIPFLASGSDSFPHPILGRPFIGSPGSATTETNLVIGPFDSESAAESALSYIATRFFRFLVLLRKPSQNATRKVYGFVPTQEWSKSWNDELLKKKYGITDREFEFIESLVRPMVLNDE